MNANFVGSVIGQGIDTVTITVTFPDGTKETLTTQTLQDRTFTTAKAYTIAGTYSAQAHVNAGNSYTAWDSEVKQFSIALTTRTGTFNVVLS